METIPHPTPTRDFNNVALKIKSQNPDLVIPANYYNEYVLLARTMLDFNGLNELVGTPEMIALGKRYETSK